ncbi:SCP2 sterol-binding domain-containing protein [Brevibacillus reuszeri]|uniref:SCP2 sterol-binding domain-containing protein n=1 Tax=Brevibacillus reuszeri TaxID=54915 RepID=UPI00289F5BE4|nr:SCP2 sterol-binding domain-containing protein [Brevibacillus reuszeri]
MSEVEAALSKFITNINKKPTAVAGFEAVYHFFLNGEEEGEYEIIFANDQAVYNKGFTCQSKCIVELSDVDLLKWLNGHLNPAASMITGKVKIKGDMLFSIKLQTLLHTFQI